MTRGPAYLWKVFCHNKSGNKPGSNISHAFDVILLNDGQTSTISVCNHAQGLKTDLDDPKGGVKCHMCSRFLEGRKRTESLRKAWERT